MRILFTLLLSVCSCTLYAQYFWMENFEAPYDGFRDQFSFDTTHHNNIWEIGRPHKVVFDSLSAYSLPNVIVTDTLHPYPPNDTSIFFVTQSYSFGVSFGLNFEYRLNIDSGAIAKMELSGDNGLNWINPITEDTTYMFYWGFSKPSFDTSTPSWQSFQLDMGIWANSYPGSPDHFPHYRTSDTILFRFTFISDSDTTTKDGWMMDNFFVQNAIMEGSVKLINNNDLINIYPVPSSGPVYIHAREASKATIVIYDMKGQVVYSDVSSTSSSMLNLNLPNGCYTLKYSTDNSYAIKRLVIIR